MSKPDPIFQFKDFLCAYEIVRSLSENLAIQFQVEGDGWDRETMQKHVNSRAALIHVQSLLMDEAERLSKLEKP